MCIPIAQQKSNQVKLGVNVIEIAFVAGVDEPAAKVAHRPIDIVFFR